ncbi:MAG: PAS domain S-box protein [Deltaproteobacteria bacterium]|nr:PAS domain S-box protein [Deltaproteobacteria bacterium]
MNDTKPLYNSRIIKVYLDYLEKYYPDVDRESLLQRAGMTLYEVEDQAHWFNQDQVDRFQEAMINQTGNEHIARDAGRYAASTEGIGILRQYTLGLMKLSTMYLMMGRLTGIMNRAVKVKVRKLGPRKVEIIATPETGVDEKPYQCQNRMGMYESAAKLFTKQLAHIDHPECCHKGDKYCRYIVSWDTTPFARWRIIRNYALILTCMVTVALLFLDSVKLWPEILIGSAILNLLLFFVSERLENKDLKKSLEMQGDAAKEHMDEINSRYNNALLVQEIGQATSTILNPRNLIRAVGGIMEKRLDFDRGAIWLASKNRTRLVYQFGYGYKHEHEVLLRKTQFHLDNPQSTAPFVTAYREQKPVLLNDIHENADKLSERSLFLARELKVRSLVCVPIVYERESLGLLTVDNLHSRRPLTQTDVSLLIGVASQTAMSLVNARSFQKMQDSEKKYRELVESANSIILRVDTNGIINFFNEFAQNFFGFEEKEVAGKNVVGTVLPGEKTVARNVRTLLKKIQDHPGKRFTTETKTKRRNGKEAWIVWTFRPITNSEGTIYEILCIGNDVTDLKEAERERRELELRLQRAHKMEAIGTLAGGVAHDLNNILAGLVSYPELLLMQIPEGSKLRKPIETIQKSGEKAASIVQDLLTLARRGVAVTEVLNLNHIISDYLKSPEFENLQVNHPAVAVEADLETELQNIMGSPVHMSKTIMNLISNAVEAMPDGGKVIVSTRNRYLDAPIKGYAHVEEGEYAVVSVSDTGIGIPEKDLDRIFEPFYTKKVMGRSGTGLGMAVVWGTVKDHNGYIDVKSTEGQGTTFTLYFPVTRRQAAVHGHEVSLQDYQGKGETILVVDDIQEQRDVASSILEKLGYKVACVTSGEEAVEWMRSSTADLVVLDMIMNPGMDGLDTYKEILKLHPGQRAIIASGFSESGRVKEAQRLGAGAYVKKPYLMEKIGMAVRNELDR